MLEQAGKEMDRLMRLAESYEQSLQLLGVLPRDPGTLAPGGVHVTQQNVTVLATKQIEEEINRLVERIPAELRPQLAQQLEAQRLVEAEKRIKPIEAMVRERAPAPIDLGHIDAVTVSKTGRISRNVA